MAKGWGSRPKPPVILVIDPVAKVRQESLPEYLFNANSSVPQTAFVKGEYNPFVFFV